MNFAEFLQGLIHFSAAVGTLESKHAYELKFQKSIIDVIGARAKFLSDITIFTFSRDV